MHNVDFVASAGEVTMIVGPNGSGKTTQMRALTGDLPFQGQISLTGSALQSLSPAVLAGRRAVLAQDNALAFPFTVSEVVGMGALSSATPPIDRHDRATRITEALAKVDLAGFAGRYTQQLSGGERQRVHLARILCQIWEPVGKDGPRWLLLDEPVSSLDISHQLTIMEIARDYARRGGGVIAVMHDLNLTTMYSDRVIVLASGAVTASGPPAIVLNDELLSRVYGCSLRVGVAPTSGHFVLPQSAMA
ncbi:MAG: heme ABC transporter ATP-binding protein [Hyphomicrobiaceae bacterium]